MWLTMIKDFRKKKHLTQEEFAEEIGVSVRHLQRLEKNESQLKLTTFKKIAKVLDFSDDDILNAIKH